MRFIFALTIVWFSLRFPILRSSVWVACKVRMASVFSQILLLLLSWLFLCHLNCCCSLVAIPCFTRFTMSFVFSPLLSFPLQSMGGGRKVGGSCGTLVKWFAHIIAFVVELLTAPFTPFFAFNTHSHFTSALKSFVRIYANERQFLPFVCSASSAGAKGQRQRQSGKFRWENQGKGRNGRRS